MINDSELWLVRSVHLFMLRPVCRSVLLKGAFIFEGQLCTDLEV